MKTQEKALPIFAKRILELRKERGWSQPELGKRIDTSAVIISRYEQGKTTPSIEVARKFADAFGVTVDFLIREHDVPDFLKNQEMITRWRDLAVLSNDEKERILSVIDSLIRDAKTREAYKAN